MPTIEKLPRPFSPSLLRPSALPSLLLLCTLGACSAGSPSSAGSGEQPMDPSPPASPTNEVTPDTPPAPAGGVMIGGGNNPDPPAEETGMPDVQMNCATGSASVSLTPVDTFIQFDRSESMLIDNKWTQASEALKGFFTAPKTAGMRIALRFFPHDLPQAGCTGGPSGACNAQACSAPLVALDEMLVETGSADPQEAKLLQAVQDAVPLKLSFLGPQSGGTPIYAALAGALAWGKANRAAQPNDKTAVILVTDGEPNGCDQNIDHIAQLAADAFAQDQIMTYAIGIAGASEAQLNQIARAGGTDHAFFASNAATAQQDLVNALDSIRGSVLSCDFPLPEGANRDPQKVNVTFTPQAGATETIGQAPDSQSCANGGWYYDDAAAPTHVTLCPSTCSRVQADREARLEIVLGCKATPVRDPQ